MERAGMELHLVAFDSKKGILRGGSYGLGYLLIVEKRRPTTSSH